MTSPQATSNSVAENSNGEGRKPVFQIARSKDELEQAFGLCYQSYYRAGLVVDNPSGLRLTPYHLLPDSEVLIGKIDQTVFSTMSLFCDGKLGLPMQSIYPRQIENLRNQGLRLAEVGSLADRRTATSRYIETFVALGRILAQAAVGRSIDALVIVVHPKHAKLYKRMMGFHQIGDYTECPYANGNPAVALYVRFDQLSQRIEEQFFGDSLSADLLMPYRWSEQTWTHFQRILQNDGDIAELTKLKGYYHWGQEPTSKIPLNLLNPVAGKNRTTV